MPSPNPIPKHAVFVHVAPENQMFERNNWTMFRYRFGLDRSPEKAELHIFADSFYSLWVNGQYLNFGPVRFDPAFPCYDTYEIGPFLTRGENVLAVLANSFGTDTYIRKGGSPAGFIAWGSAGSVDFSTHAGSRWNGIRSVAFSQLAPKLSFALNPVVIFDQSREPANWRCPTFDDRFWPTVVPVARQDHWGKLCPRPIPMPDQKPGPEPELIACRPIFNNEERFSFAVAAPDYYPTVCRTPGENKETTQTLQEKFRVVFETWIHSPVPQTVQSAMFWGERWLNGVFLEDGRIIRDSDAMRFEYEFVLRNGWNRLFGTVVLYTDVYVFTLGLPPNKGLTLHATPDLDNPDQFRHSWALKESQLERVPSLRAFPYPADFGLDEGGGWHSVRSSLVTVNPAREMEWTRHHPPVPCRIPGEPTGRFARSDFPEGFTLEYDLGHTRLFRPELHVSGAAGAIIDMAYSEQRRPDGSVRIYPAVNTHNADRFLVSEDNAVLSPWHPRGGRYVVVSVRGATETVRIDSLAICGCNYPVRPVGEFSCSDPLLNEIWEMCRRTQWTNMEDAYVDCPNRERGMYVRDTIIQYHNNLAFFGDQALMRRCLQLYTQGAMPDGRIRAVYPTSKSYSIADFCLNFSEGVRDYYAHSGDIELIREIWPACKRNIEWFLRLGDERADGLLDADWPMTRGESSHYGGFHGDLPEVSDHFPNNGLSATFNAFYLSALSAMSELAEVIGDIHCRNAFRLRHARLRENFNSVFWDSARNGYADNPERTHHSVQANATAILARMADGPRRTATSIFFRENLSSIFVNGHDPEDGAYVSPHFAYYVLGALYDLELPELAENLIRQGWGHMLETGLRTCREYHNRKLDSFCHAWSASPGYFLSKNILGIRFPLAPNLDTVEIRPIAGSAISAASGIWPHPRGELHIEWRIKNGHRCIRVTPPAGVNVVLPQP